MDDRLDLILQQPLIVVPLGLAVLAVLAWRGSLSSRALRAGPNRAIGLGLPDLLIGAGLLVATGAFFQGVAAAMLPEGTTRLVDAPPAVAVRIVVLGQLITQAPLVAYLTIRAWRRPGGLVKVGLLPRSPGRELLRGVGAFLITVPIVLMLMVLSAVVGILLGFPAPEIAHELLRLMVSPETSIVTRAALAVSVIVLGPALEEGIYRGLLQGSVSEMLGRRRRWAAVIGVAAVFAVMHLGATPWHALPALFGLGVILGWLYERTGSLWPSIIVHTLFNAFNVAVALLLIQNPQADVPVTV